MRATWTVLLAIAIGLILLQNWSPSLSLILFGRETVALPLAVWLGLGVVAGIGTSAIVQLLNYRPAASPRKADPEVAPRYRETIREKRRTRPPGKSDWEVSPSTDWNPLPEDDGGWDIDEPPAATTTPQTDFPQSDLRKAARTTRQNPQPPENSPQGVGDSAKKTRQESPRPQPSRDAVGNDATSQPQDGIYDANYRVIENPHAEESKPSPENKENWEF